VRAIERLDGLELAATVGRAGAPTFEDVLADASVDVVVLCTPNTLHSDGARRALDVGKHVAVEYPLASDPDDARALFAVAEEKGRLLHVEHIELLSPSQAAQRGAAAKLGRPREGTLSFQGAAEGWVLDEGLAGPPPLLAVARLHRLVDLFGEARVEDAVLDDRQAGYRLRVELGFREGGSVTLVEERAPNLERATRWEIRCDRGLLADPPSAPPGPLFARDTEHFVARIREGAPPYVTDDRVLHVLDLVREIGVSLRA
jgi:biliverdin reductase